MDQRAGHRTRMAQHRQQRRAEGLRETVIWLPAQVQAHIDQEIAAGRFKNRSEALSAAVERFFALKEA
jgi:metal-responsive CopG/Arc/MetJ family transcriptional regulator